MFNSKFYNKCKHAFKCIRTRLVLIRRKKQAMIRFMKKDIADLLANGLDTHAFGRMDGLIIEMNHSCCYDMIEECCDFVGKQLNSLQKQRDCPQETREAVSTLIFAAARFPDLPELCDLRHIFTERYGNFLEPFFNLEFVQKLDSELFTNEEKFEVMQSIAEESSVCFDTKALEIKLWTAAESKDDLIGKDSPKQVELAIPFPNKQNDGEAPLERKSEATAVGPKQNLEELKPIDVQAARAVANGVGQLNDNSGKPHSDKPDGMEHLEKSVSPLFIKGGNTQKDHIKPDCKDFCEKSVSPLDMKMGNTPKEDQKSKKRDSRPSEKELMEAVELDINGLPKQESVAVKCPETESNNKIVPPIANPKETKKEHGVEKENDRGPGYPHRSQMSGRPDHNGRHTNLGFKALGLQNQGPSSLNPSIGKITNMPPPYAKPNGLKGDNCDGKEEWNRFLHGRPQHLADPGHTEQDGHRAPDTAANMQPPYVKPVSVRRKKPPAPVNAYYGQAPKDDNITSRTPSSHRRQSSKHKGASDGCDQKGGVGNDRNVERTPSGRSIHSGRRNDALYNNDHDGSMQRTRASQDETAIYFGNLLPRAANGHRRLNSSNTDVRDGDLDEEERMMDKLLMHYSKKGLVMDEAKTRTETGITVNSHGTQTQCQQYGSTHPPGRAVSLPPGSVSTDEAAKVPARSTSLRPECPRSVHVHPRMPDFEELAARVTALRNA